MGRIDNYAHLGGLAGGFVVAYLGGEGRFDTTVSRKVWSAASWVCILITAWSFLQMYLWMSRSGQ